MRTSTKLALPIAAAILITACNPTEFDSLRGGASVVSFAPGGNESRAGHGNVIATYAVDLGAAGAPRPVSRFAASGGADSAFYVYPAFDASGDAMGRLRPAFGDSLFQGCTGEERACGAGRSASLAAFPAWLSIEPGIGMQRGCVAAPSTALGFLAIRCETRSGVAEGLMAAGGVQFGASAVGLPAGTTMGVALFGAPADCGMRGGLYVLPMGSSPMPIGLDALALSASTRLGTSIAAFGLASDQVLVAMSGAPEPASGAVVDGTRTVAFFVLSDNGMGGIDVSPHGCMRDEAVGFGHALAIGDLDDDGMPEIAVGRGIRDEPNEAAGPVEIYSFASLSAGQTCIDAEPTPTTTLECPDSADMPCAGAQFGSALAIGDVNADGVGDLVVGAPRGTVNGLAEVGTVHVFAGESGSLGDLDAVHATLTHSAIESSMHIGSALGLVDAGDRMEIVAGAPGTNAQEALVFLCSGLPGDRPEDFVSTGAIRGCVPR